MPGNWLTMVGQMGKPPANGAMHMESSLLMFPQMCEL